MGSEPQAASITRYIISPVKQNVKYYFCLPEKVLENWQQLETLGFIKVPNFNPSYLRELITLIAMNQNKDEGTAFLKAAYLKKLVPGYKAYIELLIGANVIRRSGRYVPGELSYGYAFTSDYLSRYRYFPVNDMYLVKRIQKNNLKRHNTRRHPGQAAFIRKMTIVPEAFDAVRSFSTIEKFNAGLASVLKIQHGEIFYSVDNTSGRFHSNLTNLPESLRQFIRINGKPLASIDIRNSQPYFSTILLRQPQKAAPFAKSHQLSMLLQTLKGIESMDVIMFIYLVNKGNLYEFLMGAGFSQDRKKAKRQLFIIMFGPAYYWSKQHEIFEKWFPLVYERFNCIKGHTKGSKFENYKRFAILLQSVEAHLILNVILRRINTEHPETIAVTIHDSVLTSDTTNDVKQVQGIMEKELTSFVGLPPTLKVEKNEIKHPNQKERKEREKKEEQSITQTKRKEEKGRIRKDNTITIPETL